jgi:hypothetical protein
MIDHEDSESATIQAIRSILDRAMIEAHIVISAATSAAHEAATRDAATAADTKQPDEDLPPYNKGVPYGVALPPALCRDYVPNGLAGPVASIAKIVWPAHVPYSPTQVWQQWDVYGDTCLLKHTSYPPQFADDRDRPPTVEVLGRAFAPPIGGRAKLTREYQEIMWAVAPVMDASFLRPIFDRYNPRAPALASRKAELDARGGKLDAREAELREHTARVDAITARHSTQVAAFERLQARHNQLQAQRDQRESARRDELHEANPDKFAMQQTLNAQIATIITLKATIRKVADKLLIYDPHAHESVNKYAAELFNAIADRAGK